MLGWVGNQERTTSFCDATRSGQGAAPRSFAHGSAAAIEACLRVLMKKKGRLRNFFVFARKCLTPTKRELDLGYLGAYRGSLEEARPQLAIPFLKPYHAALQVPPDNSLVHRAVAPWRVMVIPLPHGANMDSR